MSGHSHWAQIRRKKTATDALRGTMYGKVTRLITLAAREGGSNLQTNAKLRALVEKARSINMPRSNITRAIERGAGSHSSIQVEQFLIDAYAPGGLPLLIEVITDNRNRSLGEIKTILTEHGGKIGGEGTTRWLFTPVVAAHIHCTGNRDDALLRCMDAGVADFDETSDGAIVYIDPERFDATLPALKRIPTIAVQSYEYRFRVKHPMPIPAGVSPAVLAALIDALEHHSDVHYVSTAASRA
ncbi:MAG: YebC/PmpR family DNA-binding transcriptional regulator [Parcubacteria group bacterium]|nr:YebC/PmpR family DNA-binding transcriptional regulator [Parcubacteria group bacterium]